MAGFGVTSAIIATFLSMFMAGLGLGSWASPILLRKYRTRLEISPLLLYALVEFLIGMSALLVPLEFKLGHDALVQIGRQLTSTSLSYSLLSGVILALTVIPWCTCMGATFPIAMYAVRLNREEETWSFSYLYLANLLGAMAGATIPLILIERLGFSRTLYVGLLLNLSIAVCAAVRSRMPALSSACFDQFSRYRPLPRKSDRLARSRWFLFASGLTTMGMEVVWTRMFTPFLGTVVYAFAAILGAYIVATFVGSKIYRAHKSRPLPADVFLFFILGIAVLLPSIAASPNLAIPRLLRLPLGVVPWALAAGFVTPMLVDRESRGDPEVAGSAYATNVLGCVVGPLIVGFALLPLTGERWTLVALSAPWLLAGVFATSSADTVSKSSTWRMNAVAAGFVASGCILAFLARGFEEQFPKRRVLRDSTATIVATGETRFDKQLLINGYGVTNLTPVTKMMAHLPMAFQGQPQQVLVVCFGMGTTHRSALAWAAHSTVVELSPSVPQLFSYYHADGDQLMKSSRSRIVIDDGRRFLERSNDTYDVITIDPPPPIQAAGSSLLYSREFYEIAKRHLSFGGVLQQWLPSGGDGITNAAITRALTESFPYVRAFGSFDSLGIHFIARMQPLPLKSGHDLVSGMPSGAVMDLLEWEPRRTAEEQFDLILHNEIPAEQLVQKYPRVPSLRDDRPINEYFWLRSLYGNTGVHQP